MTRLAGKNVVKVYLLDNSMKTLLVEDDATVQVPRCCSVSALLVLAPMLCGALSRLCAVQHVVLEMCQKLGLRDFELISPCFGLHECSDGVTSAFAAVHCLDRARSAACRGCGRAASRRRRVVARNCVPHAVTPGWWCVGGSTACCLPAVSPPLSDNVLVVPMMASWTNVAAAKFVMTVKLYMESQVRSRDTRVQYLHYIQGVYNVITGIYPTSLDECISLSSLQVQAKFGDHNPAM